MDRLTRQENCALFHELSLYNRAVGSVTEARRGDPLPSPSWGSEARALEGMKQGGFPDQETVPQNLGRSKMYHSDSIIYKLGPRC
jgi:hypothetical protein